MPDIKSHELWWQALPKYANVISFLEATFFFMVSRTKQIAVKNTTAYISIYKNVFWIKCKKKRIFAFWKIGYNSFFRMCERADYPYFWPFFQKFILSAFLRKEGKKIVLPLFCKDFNIWIGIWQGFTIASRSFMHLLLLVLFRKLTFFVKFPLFIFTEIAFFFLQKIASQKVATFL